MLLFLFTMGFTSCSEDDKQEYYLELSQNSCEVIQGYSISIDLTAHENTTLNVENPELIDAAYIWELDDYKAKIEIKGKQKGETDLVVTDHETGESATIKVKVTEYPMPRLAIKQSKGNIFDTMNFYLYNEDSKSINSNSLSVTITDEKDFLEYNWKDITKNSSAWSTYADVLKSSPNLMTTYGLCGTVPYAEVRVFNSNMTQSYQLYDYFCKLYSVPTYEDNRDKMWQLYDELFSEQKVYPSAYPVAIWVTERVNIVLLLLDDNTGYSNYVVYAEPNRQ